MATPIKNNLPPASQQWVRDIERRMADLERHNQLLQVTANKNATQIGAIQSALAGVSNALSVIDGKITTSSVSIAISSTGAKTQSTFTAPPWATGALVSFNYGGFTGAPADGDVRVIATASNAPIPTSFLPVFPEYVRAGDVYWVGAPTYSIAQSGTAFCPVDLSDGQSTVYARPYVTQLTTGTMTMLFNYVIIWT